MSISDIQSVLKSKIDDNIEFSNSFFVALSSKDIALSQVSSELNKLYSGRIRTGSLLESLLRYNSFDNKLYDLQEEDLIQISDIDESQKLAVMTAFNSRLSVITGPPGSGKTQVILNILANAVLHNKKVLVASKINKAVDNVKERFDRIDNLGYFLRFGSKDVLIKNTIPSIEKIINIIPHLEVDKGELLHLKEKINSKSQVVKENKAKLAERDELRDEMHSIDSNIENLVKQEKNLVLLNTEIDFFRLSYDVGQLDSIRSILKLKRNIVESKYSGLGKIWFDWFKRQRYTQEILSIIEQYPIGIKSYIQTKNFKLQYSDFKNGKDIIQLYTQLIVVFSNSIEYIQNYAQIQNEIIKLQNRNVQNENIIREITNNESDILLEIEKGKQEINKIGKPLLVELIKNKIKNAKIPSINNYKNYLPDNIPWKDAEINFFTNATKAFLDTFNISTVTSLSAKAAFPLGNELFDMVVIDEASQCDFASAIPLIFRTKQLVIIGDPLQLRHISRVNDYEEAFIKENLLVSKYPYLNYSKKSLYDYCKDFLGYATTSNNYPIILDYHYRCHPQIISFSNEAFYAKYLSTQLTICTKDEQFNLKPKGIKWVDIKGEQKANNVNINEAEVLKCIDIATKLAEKNVNISIGIVTPFRAQAEALNAKIPSHLIERIIASTVYKFQGDEKDVMIYSLVVTDNSPLSKIRWIDESQPNLVNVAVTRARNTLYVVGNKEYVRSKSSLIKPLGKLVQYYERINND